jgi:uncharacterized iron-regulated protein
VFVLFSNTPLVASNLQTAMEKLECKIAFAERSLMDRRLKRYQSEFLNAYRSMAPKGSLTAKQMSKKLQESKLILLNDHHADTKSQAFSVDLIAALSQKKKDLKVVIEWIERKDQKHLDAYLQGAMSLETLKKKISFDETWGFSWNSYKEILKTAKNNAVDLIAVESRLQTNSVYERDSLIANGVSEVRRQNPEATILVIYGTYHLIGKHHLKDKVERMGMKVDMVLLDHVSSHLASGLERFPNKDYLDLGNSHYFIKLGEPIDRLLFEYLYYERLDLI